MVELRDLSYLISLRRAAAFFEKELVGTTAVGLAYNQDYEEPGEVEETKVR